MSRQIGSLNRSLSYPSNLQRHSLYVSVSDITPSPVPSYTNHSSHMDSDDNSTRTALHTISQFDNSDIETPDEFQNSEPSPSTLSQTPSVHSTPQFPMNLPQSYTDATYTDANPILFPMTSDQPDLPSPVNEELENELDNFTTLQQQPQNPNTLTFHHLL